MTRLDIYRGIPFGFRATLTDYDGNPIDLTDCSVIFTMKLLDDNTLNDDAAIIKKSLTLYDAANGVADLSLSSTDTNVQHDALYKCDIKVIGDGVNENTELFHVYVKQAVTMRTS